MCRVKAKDAAPQDFKLFINEEMVYESAYPFERVALTEKMQDKVQDLLDYADIMNVLMG